MSNLPRTFRQELTGEWAVHGLREVRRQVSSDRTEKYLLKLQDGESVEVVYIPELDRGTVCVSSQVGCALGCRFCATASSGFSRDLQAAEIVGQVLWVQRRHPVSNVVFMGMGEPLANFSEVVRAVRLLNEPAGMAIGMRRITISTCGLVPEIRQLASLGLQLGLAVSLHAADDGKRSQLMPINNRYPLSALLEACSDYIASTGRRITFEYALISGFNDSLSDAQTLCTLLRSMKCNVNVIPVNPAVLGFRRPLDAAVSVFVDQLLKRGLNAVVRRERGTDIDAACGQLRCRSGLESRCNS